MLGSKQQAIIRPVVPAPIPGLAEAMAAQEWETVDVALFSGHLEDQVMTVTRSLYGAPQPHPAVAARAGGTAFGDAFCGVVNGRTVVVANSWTGLGGENGSDASAPMGVAVCVAELASRLSIRCVQPRQLPPVSTLPAVPTGNPAFDERFAVAVAPGPPQPMMLPEVQQRFMAHDDWVFLAERYRLVCVSRGTFRSPEEMGTRINEIVALVAAFPIPAPLGPANPSVDDLLARNPPINTLPEALAFLQNLNPTDREMLARSNTPLAAMADVQTPDEALERYKSLDQSQKTEIMGTFMRANRDRV